MTTPCELVGAERWDSPSVLFISDLHLSPQSPLAMRAFSALLSEQASSYDSLLILGDLFEVYAGDDALQHDAFTAQVAAALKNASQHCRIGIMHGNRDFLIGLPFCEAAGAALLADPCVLEFDSSATLLLSHGDSWCTLDADYQSKKLEIRSPQWQSQVLGLPWSQRWALASNYREQSMAQRASTAGLAVDAQIYDVQAAAFEASCVAHGVLRGLHGHTHAPAKHDVPHCLRYVLGDWQFDANLDHLQAAGTAIVGAWQLGEVQLMRYDGATLQTLLGA